MRRLRIGQPRSLQSRQLWAASLGLVAFLALAGYALDRAFLADMIPHHMMVVAMSQHLLRSGGLHPDVARVPRAGEIGPGARAR